MDLPTGLEINGVEQQQPNTTSSVSGSPTDAKEFTSGPNLSGLPTDRIQTPSQGGDSFDDIYGIRRTPADGGSSDESGFEPQLEDYPPVSCNDSQRSTQKITDTAMNENLEKSAKHRLFLDSLGKRWVTVEPMIIIYYIMFTSLWPTLQQYIHYRLEQEYNITSTNSTNQTYREQCLERGHEAANHTSPEEQAFQKQLSLWNTILVVTAQLPVVFVMFIIGPLSDARGRRLAMLPQILAQTITCAITGVVMWLDLPLWILVLSNAINGLTGAHVVVFMAAYAYIADINTPEKRLIRLVLLEVGTGLGAFVSGITIGWVIGHWGFKASVLILTGLMAIMFVYVIFFVPETIFRDAESKAPLVSCSNLSDLPQLWVKGGGVRGTLPIIWLCFLIMFFNGMVNDMGFMIITLYIIDPPLCWNSFMVGLYNGINFAVKALGCVGFMALLKRLLRPPYLQLIGTVSACLFYICFGFATHLALPFIGSLLGSAALLVAPVTRSVASTVVGERQQGALFAGLGFAQMVSTLVGSPLVNTLFGAIPVLEHRYIFLGIAAFCFIPFTLIIILLVVSKRTSKTDNVNLIDDSISETMDGVIN